MTHKHADIVGFTVARTPARCYCNMTLDVICWSVWRKTGDADGVWGQKVS